MRRREFLTVLGGAVSMCPVAAWTQQPVTPTIGFLWYGSAEEWAPFVKAYRRGLKEVGFVEGQNVAIEFRWTEGQTDRQRALAVELVRRDTSVIVTGTVGGLAAKAATTTIPIVFIVGTDPMKTGLIASFNRPGGNVTGVSFFSNELAAKRLGLLHELLPQAKVIAVLINPKFPDAVDRLTEIQDAARTLGLQVRIFNASTESEIDARFADVALRQADALVIAADPYFTARRNHIIALAERHALPAIYDLREWASTGGLISYGTDLADAFRQSGFYTGRILKGTKPTDLPVIQSAKYELVINLKTAKALGLTVPPSLLARADEVIE